MVCHGYGWAPPGLFGQDTQRMNEYLSVFEPIYLKRTGQVLCCTATLQPYPVKEMIMMMGMREGYQ